MLDNIYNMYNLHVTIEVPPMISKFDFRTEQMVYLKNSAGNDANEDTHHVLLSCQPRVTVTSCFVYKVISDLESIDHLCINPSLWIGLIHK